MTDTPPVASLGDIPARAGHQAFGRLWAGLRPYLRSNGRRMALFTSTTLIGGLGEAFLLYLVVRVATAMAAGQDAVTIEIGPLAVDQVSIGQLFLTALVLVAVLVLLATIAATVAARMSMAALVRARRQTFDAFISSSWALQSREREGHLQELLTTHVKKLSQAVIVATDGITASVSFTAFIVSAIVISPVAAVTILAGVVVLYLALRPITRLTRTSSRQHSFGNTGYSMSVSQAVAMAREIRAFDVGDTFRNALGAEAEAVAVSGFRTRLLAKLTPRLYQQVALLLVVVAMAGVWLADIGEMAELGAVVLLLVRALTYSQDLQTAIQQANEMAPYLERLEEQEELYRAHPVRFGAGELGRVEDVRFRQVTFAYEPGRPVLSGISFSVDAGETIGIVGPSGSGKSTLVQVLLGLRSPDEGEYLVNGRPAESYRLDSWFRQFVLVPQDNRLLTATVAENIRFHRGHVRPDDVRRAARLAHLDAEIEALPAGYDTTVGSGWMDLSGGQRQRLGLARALAGDPSVLVLDEPTSALDMRSEALVQETLEELQGRLMLFIVAHRVTTLSRCDRIMVLRDGVVDDFDTPDALLRANAFFREVTRLSAIP
jgi:ATP-binding cassette, subfamily B, bacterial